MRDLKKYSSFRILKEIKESDRKQKRMDALSVFKGLDLTIAQVKARAYARGAETCPRINPQLFRLIRSGE